MMQIIRLVRKILSKAGCWEKGSTGHVQGKDPQVGLNRMVKCLEEVIDKIVVVFAFQMFRHNQDERTVQDAE